MVICNTVKSLIIAKDDIKFILDIKGLDNLKWHFSMNNANMVQIPLDNH